MVGKRLKWSQLQRELEYFDDDDDDGDDDDGGDGDEARLGWINTNCYMMLYMCIIWYQKRNGIGP